MTPKTRFTPIRSRLAGSFGILATLGLFAGTATGEGRPDIVTIVDHAFEFRPVGDAEGWTLSLRKPDGTVDVHTSDAGEPIRVKIAESSGVLADGLYKYELRGRARISPEVLAALEAARQRGDDEAVNRLRETGDLPRLPLLQVGHFWVRDGKVVAPSDALEPSNEPLVPSPQAQVIEDDLIVHDSICSGFDCVSGESFGPDTIRLKENNLRIHFDDSSTTPFPNNDWELRVNDINSGGENYFAIGDRTSGRTPFLVEAGASDNAVYVDSSGRVGFRTSTPVLDLHVNTSDTPAMRLEQNNSGSFDAQTWDIAGNEANFFVRDVTNGSLLSFVIKPGAPTGSLAIDGTGNVGMGTREPQARAHVFRSDGTAKLLVHEGSATTLPRELAQLKNNGPVTLRLENCQPSDQTPTASCSASVSWLVQAGDGGFSVKQEGSGGSQLLLRDDGRIELGPGSGAVFTLDVDGNLDISGALSQSSDVNVKEAFSSINGADVLSRIAELPILAWSFKSDASGVRHLGPMAQDFYRLFGVGRDERHIAPLDASGVALAAIQELHRELQAKDQALSALETKNEALEARLAALEAKMTSVTSAPSPGSAPAESSGAP